MRQINDTTFISDNLGDLKPVVTIGGKPIDKFIPNLNMSFHDDEFFINLNRRDKQAINTTDKAEIDGTDKDIFYIDENGRFKWDIEFKERPSKNSWTWELKHAEGIEFYYQGELTLEELADGFERPLEVVGSYAVYCNKANNKYKTGKLCHIYRPFCYDINGESIYADLLIADGQLTISIDEAWLDNAVYPVRLDPTIGYTTRGGSSYAMNSISVGIKGTTDINGGIIQSFHGYFNYTATANVKMCIAETSGGVPSGQDVLEQIEFSVTSADAQSASASGLVSLNPDTIYAALAMSSSWVIGSRYDAIPGNGVINASPGTYASQFPSPLGSGWNVGTNCYSFWVTYEQSGGTIALPSIINNHRQQGVM